MAQEWGPVRVESYLEGFDVSANLSTDEEGALVGHSPVAVIYPSGFASPAEKLADFASSGCRRLPFEQLNEALAARLRADMPMIAAHFSFRHYARLDFRFSLEQKKLFFLESNLCPNFEPEDNFAVGANWAGMSYSTMLQNIFSVACRDAGLG
jgi:D-alanine-D-alanine ligase-like ATP-grasp enzyme